jgi:thioredoxin 1
MAAPVTVSDATFRTEVIESDRPVLVFFWAEWNSTCKGQAPSIRQLAEEEGDGLTVAMLDVDANPVTPAMFGVAMVPTVMLFRGGQALLRIVGYRRLDVLRTELQAALISA